MKSEIHPDYHFIKVVMTDGTEYTTRSTLSRTAIDFTTITESERTLIGASLFTAQKPPNPNTLRDRAGARAQRQHHIGQAVDGAARRARARQRAGAAALRHGGGGGVARGSPG